MTPTPSKNELPNLGVYQAISEVMADMSKEGMAKRQRNTAQNFNFRGIDDVYNGLSPSLSKHGLVILPSIAERQVTERNTRNGGVMLHVILIVDYTLICAKDGSWHTCRAYGEAMDSGDKATNKALAAAYKYMCFQTFCIPIEGAHEDADAESPEIGQPKKPVAKTVGNDAWDEETSQCTRDVMLEAIDWATTDDELAGWWKRHTAEINKLLAADRAVVIAAKDDKKQALKGEAA